MYIAKGDSKGGGTALQGGLCLNVHHLHTKSI